MLHLISCNIQYLFLIHDKKTWAYFLFSQSVINIQYMPQHIGVIKRIYKNGNTEKYVQTRYFRWHSPSSFISDAIRLVTKKKGIPYVAKLNSISIYESIINSRLYPSDFIQWSFSMTFFAMTEKRI